MPLICGNAVVGTQSGADEPGTSFRPSMAFWSLAKSSRRMIYEWGQRAALQIIDVARRHRARVVEVHAGWRSARPDYWAREGGG